MKTLVTILCTSMLFLGVAEGKATARRRAHSSALPKRARSPKQKGQRRDGLQREQPPKSIAEEDDEIQLSPLLLRKLQSNLVDGGYLRGTVDGRLTHRTRRALAEFQREYHMTGTGRLDRATAEALLGTEEIRRFVPAQKDLPAGK